MYTAQKVKETTRCRSEGGQTRRERDMARRKRLATCNLLSQVCKIMKVYLKVMPRPALLAARKASQPSRIIIVPPPTADADTFPTQILYPHRHLPRTPTHTYTHTKRHTYKPRVLLTHYSSQRRQFISFTIQLGKLVYKSWCLVSPLLSTLL